MSTPEMENANKGSVGFDPARWLWLLDKASPQLITQLGLHGQLMHLEWQQEKRRLQWIMLYSVLSISFVFLAFLFAGFALLYLNRNNESFTLVIWTLPVVFTLLAAACFFLIHRLGSKGQSAFNASFQELKTDLQLLRRQV
ncbi:phage holin family protein [Rheinheimera sp. 1928-s]|uniref:phage holin family protein n=1 Tax=Rheinheimera sp. 1928-s TaxID=3033803 RepID=UPI00260BE3E3|nr:phage holin family protein [Rheinheimera sp. 1928-s]MDF3127158.1 phage holin family protein [Rheinheimera sp. 1928-s]